VHRIVSRAASTRWQEFVPILLLGSVGIGLTRVCIQFIGHDLNFDEAYILQAVDSLVGERRYASYGVARGFGPWDFDPNLTTGPALTLPLAPLWWASSGSLVAVRMFMFALFVAYCAGLVVLTRGLPKRTAMTALVLLPGVIVAPSYLGEALGELPGSMLFVWAFVALRSGHFRVAAFLIGLSVQAKLVFLTMGIGVLIPFLWSLWRTRSVRRAELLILSGLASLPTLVFEIWRLIALGGLTGYRGSIDELRAYISLQNVNVWGGWTEGGRHIQKWNFFVGLLPSAVWLLVILAVLFFLYELASRFLRRDSAAPMAPLDQALVGAGVSGVVMFLGWWTQSVQDPPRQVLAVVLVAVPAVFVLAVRAFEVRPRRIPTSLWIAGVFLALVGSAPAWWADWRFDMDPISESQREVVALLSEENVSSILASGWYQFPELQLLARVPAVQWAEPDGQVAILDHHLRFGGGISDSDFLGDCQSVLLRRPEVIVCRPEVPVYEALSDLSVVNWGERDVRFGETSNPQINGFGGIWIVIEPENPVALRAIQVLVDGDQIEIGEVSSQGDVITALVPPSVYRTPGRHVIELRNAISGQVIPVGEFTL
jgi:hypothetical protein